MDYQRRLIYDGRREYARRLLRDALEIEARGYPNAAKVYRREASLRLRQALALRLGRPYGPATGNAGGGGAQ